MTDAKPLLEQHTFFVRDLANTDIPLIVNYWRQLAPADFIRMGVDASKLPTAGQFSASLEALIEQPIPNAKSFYSIWVVNGVPIGAATLKNIQISEHGEMHLHIWNETYRGKGYGAILFCLSALSFYKTFQLKTIKCEPCASNPMPNKMFAKIGFPFLGKRFGASSELSAVCELNQYSIPAKIATQYLRDAGAPIEFCN